MIYVVRWGTTLSAVSRQYGVPVETLARVNQIPDPDVLVEGQALLIPEERSEGILSVEVGGYAYPFISPWVLRETLERINGLAVFSYGFTPTGELLPPALNDRWMVQRAAEKGVRPVLVMTPLDRSGVFSNYLIHTLLGDPAAQTRLLQKLENRMQQFGYGELNIDFEFILPEDRDRFTAFVEQAVGTLSVPVSVCLAPKMSRTQRGLLFEGKDFAALGRAADRVLLMTYEWGYKYGPPMAVAPIEQVRWVVQYALSEIPAEKICLGMANYGYDWPLPFVQGQTVARTIGSIEAVDIARKNKTNIIFDWPSKSPWFQYTDARGVRHVVWFEDVRSWQYKMDLVKEYGLAGVGIWTVMNLNRPGLMLIEENFRREGL